MFVVQRVALEESPPLWVAAGRAGVAALVLLAWAPRLRSLSRRGVGAVVVLGLLNQVGFIGLQVAGLRTVAAGPAAAIVYLQPVLVVIASGPVLGERLTARHIGAALLGFAGVAVVGLHQSAEASAGGVLLLLAAAVSWTAGALVTSASSEPIVALVVGQHLVGAPVLVAAAAIAEPFPSLSAKLVASISVAGVFGSAMGWMLWSALLRRGEASVVSTWLFAVPVLAAVLGVVFLSEPLSVALIGGIALVAAAVRLAASAPSADRDDDDGTVARPVGAATAPVPGTAASRDRRPEGRSTPVSPSRRS
jgi:drug/metabolite transporter (DMT)-like permease